MAKIRNYGLEDQGVTRFTFKDGQIELGLEWRDEGREPATDVSVLFTNISNLEISNPIASEIGFVSESGEVIHFESDGQHMLLIIFWRFPNGRSSETVCYDFDFEDMRVTRSSPITI